MNWVCKSGLIALLGCGTPGAATAATAATAAEAVSGWTVEGGGGACSMLRPYNKHNPTWVIFGRDVDDQQFIRVHDDRWKVKKGQEYPATLTFDGVETVLAARGAITDGATQTGGFVATSNIDWQAKLATASRMSVKIPGNIDASIDLAGAPAALAAMIECTKSAARRGEVALRSGPRVIKPLTLAAIDYSDLPKTGITSATVAIRLFIDATGTPNRCDIIASTGSPTIDARSCALAVDRMRFSPAVAKNGRPTTSSYQFRIALR